MESNQIISMQVAFEGGPLPTDFTAAHICCDEYLSFASNNSKKPQQNGRMGTPGPEHWTFLSTAMFAEREFNTNPKGYRRIAEARIFDAFARLLGLSNGLSKFGPSVNRINHWEDGLPATTPPNSRGCLFDADVGLGWVGDFCVMPGVQGAALSGQAMGAILGNFLCSQDNFDRSHLLPSDEDWVPFQPQGATMMDIGCFANGLGLKPRWTHTDLVPSAVDGYDPAAQFGAAGRSQGAKGKGFWKGKRDKGVGKGLSVYTGKGQKGKDVFV